jgi:hypothetical protein
MDTAERTAAEVISRSTKGSLSVLHAVDGRLAPRLRSGL